MPFFEIDELDVVAGTDVAYATALLRCGSPTDLTATPDKRLRLSLGLVKREGEWLVQHEHHSFTAEPDPYRGEMSVREIHEGWFADTEAKNLDGIMAHIASDVVSYEHEAPLEYIGADEVRAMCKSGLDQTTGKVTWTVPELTVVARDDLAVGRVVDPVGRRLFENLGELRVLELARATPTPTGSIWLTYRMP